MTSPTLFASAQLLFDLLLVGDVDKAANEANGFALRVPERHSTRQVPNDRAVAVSHSELNLEIFTPSVEVQLNIGADAFEIIGMNCERRSGPKIARSLFEPVAE